PAESALRDPLPRVLGEDGVLDEALAVLAHPAQLAREDDRRLALERHHDVRVAVEQAEAGEVAHGALEARVLGACDDDGVEPVARGGPADVAVAAIDLLPARPHADALPSSPLTSAVSARFSGASTPLRSPKATMAPFRKSISVGRPASTSWSMLGLWSYETSLRAAKWNSSTGSESRTIPCTSATALPSAITASASSRVGPSSAMRPCVKPVSAAIGFEAALKISLRHCAPRASSSACVGMPALVHASATSRTFSIGAGRGSNGPICVSPRVSMATWPGSTRWPAGKVVPRITCSTCSAITSSFPAPFCTEQTAPSRKAAAVAAIAEAVCMLFVATRP